MLAYYVHDLNPVIFKIWKLEPRWYGFAYLCGFVAAYFILIRLARRGMLRMPSERVPDFVLNGCIFGVLLGGRFGYCLFYEPALLGLARDAAGNVIFPYWGVLAVWRGGMAAHGGVLVTIITIMVFVWKSNRAIDRWKAGETAKKKDAPKTDPALLRKLSFVNISDAACMVVPIGLFFGRIANFVNGELYGHPGSVPWAVRFPTEILNRTNNQADLPIPKDKLQPDQIERMVAWAQATYEQLNIRTLADLEAHKKLQEAEQALQYYDAERIATWVRDHYPQAQVASANDLIGQLQHGSAEVSEAIRGKLAVMQTLPAHHPSQLYEALLEGALLFVIVWIIGRKWRWDGMASGAFLTLYPIMRIIGEQFRVGDAPKNILGITLSLGVWYSVAMFIPGIIYWAYWIKKARKAEWTPELKPAKTIA